ncbi:Ankyrin repeat-containing domain protein [Elaphomyces granulatus]
MPLSNLLVKIFLNIADYYLDDVEMNTLVRTNKDAHSLLNETLYQRAMTRWDMMTRAAENGDVGTIQQVVHAAHQQAMTRRDTTNILTRAAEIVIQRVVHAATGRHFNPVPASFYIALQVALQVATAKEHVPIVELLLKVEGINPNFYSASFEAPLYAESLEAPLLIAARRGNSAIVELLLAKVNIDPDVRDHGHTVSPLLYACLGGHVSIVRELLARDNVDINCKGRGAHNWTPLTAACYERNTEIISLLLTKDGIDVNESSDYGTPLMIAVKMDHVEVVKSLLVRADVDPNIPNRDGFNALCDVVSSYRYRRKPLEISKMLLERDDIDVNLRDPEGRTALSWACINGCLELVDLILKKDNVDPNIRDNIGCTPFTEACRLTRSRGGVEPLEISKILLERDDIDVNLRDDKGRTALSWACINGCLELVDLILKKDNIDPNIRDNTGRTPLAEACRFSVKPAVIRSLLSHCDTVVPGYKDIGYKDILGLRMNFSIQIIFVSE